MLFQFGRYELDIDVNKTREAYEQLLFVSEGCTCDGCQNYQDAIMSAPKQVISFFNSIGADMQKPCEIYVNTSEDGSQKLFYGGFYHLCGRVINGDSAWILCNDKSAFYQDKSKTYEIVPDYNVWFQPECALLEDVFSPPTIQMEIEFHIPWVLERENTYSG